jgi:hypothetical protein
MKYVAPKITYVELRLEERILTCVVGSCVDYSKQSDEANCLLTNSMAGS